MFQGSNLAPRQSVALSEEILKAIDVTSHQVEVFKFEGDFNELLKRESVLVDVDNTVEFHMPGPGGSMVKFLKAHENNQSSQSAYQLGLFLYLQVCFSWMFFIT